MRIFNLGTHDLWYDEVITVYSSKDLDFLYDPQQPLYYFLLHFWIKWFKESEFNLRLLSTIFGIASIIIIYKIGKMFFDWRTGLISAFILSISPIHIWYSQEARGYTLLTFLVILRFYFFFLALREDKIYFWMYFSIASILSIYTSYFAFFIIPAEMIVFCMKKYRHLMKKWLLCYFFILFTFLPWLLTFLKQLQFIKSGFWLPKPTLKSVFITFENFIVGYNATEIIYLFSTILVLILFVLGVYHSCKENKRGLIFLIPFLFIPILGSFLLSQWIPIYIDRQLIAFSPFYYLIITTGLVNLKRKLIKGVILIIFITLVGNSLLNYYLDYMPSSNIHHLGTYTKKPFKPAIRFIKENLKQGDIIAHSNRGTQSPFEYYWAPKVFNQYYFIIPNAQDEYWRRILTRRLERGDKHIIELNRGLGGLDPKRIWLISSSWARDGNLDDNSSAVTKWMEQHYVRVESKEFDGIFVGLYEQMD